MKWLFNKTWYGYQTQLAELKIQVGALQKENRDLMKENLNLKQEVDSLRHSLEMANEIIANTGVTRGKDGRFKSKKK